MTSPHPKAGLFPWVLRGVLALAALAAPIVVFRGFTDPDTPDPVKQQQLREASRAPAVHLTTDGTAGARP